MTRGCEVHSSRSVRRHARTLLRWMPFRRAMPPRACRKGVAFVGEEGVCRSGIDPGKGGHDDAENVLRIAPVADRRCKRDLLATSALAHRLELAAAPCRKTSQPPRKGVAFVGEESVCVARARARKRRTR